MTAIFSFFCGIALSSLWYAQGRQLGSYVPFFLIKAGALSIHDSFKKRRLRVLQSRYYIKFSGLEDANKL
jgi:hypothetical protein